MAKKYMVCDNMDLIKKFNVPFIRTTISSRCNRILCSCGALIDGTKHTCSETDGKNGLYFHLSGGYTTLVYEHENLLIEENTDELGKIEYKIYFPTLGIDVSQYTGKLTLTEKRAYVATFTTESINMYSVKNGEKIPVEKIKNLIFATLGKEYQNIFKYFQIANTLGLQSVANLCEYLRIIGQRNCSLFENEEFVKDHKDVINDIVKSSYGASDITDEDKLCEYYKIPRCLYKFTSDEYYRKVLRDHSYKNIVGFGNFPQRVIGWISYYMEIGKFTKASVSEFMNEFNSSFFDSDLKIDCFVKFIVKNQYLGDKTFAAAKNVFRYLDKNNIELNENTLNSKYYYNTTNYKELCETIGVARADEFECLRETSGIIVAMKRLLEN